MATSSILKKVPIPPRGVDYRGKVVLAPMVRGGELPTRLLALHYGADLVWSPETVDHSMMGTTRVLNADTNVIEWTKPTSKGEKSVMFAMHPEREGRRLIFQVGSSDPDRAVEAAKKVAADVAGIDVNAGCPKPFSTSGGMGAALLRTPDRLCAILDALVANITPEFGIGISVKIRMLENPAETEALVRRLAATGITALTVHCRYPSTRKTEPVMRHQLAMVRDVCREAGVACLVNGDVANRDHGLDLMREYGVDGAMIAGAAEKNPSCFRTLEDGGLAPWQEVTEHYVQEALDVGNKFGNTKYLLAHLIPAKKASNGLSSSKDYATVCRYLGYESKLAQAKRVDDLIDWRRKLNAETAKKEKERQRELSKQKEGGKNSPRINNNKGNKDRNNNDKRQQQTAVGNNDRNQETLLAGAFQLSSPSQGKKRKKPPSTDDKEYDERKRAALGVTVST